MNWRSLINDFCGGLITESNKIILFIGTIFGIEVGMVENMTSLLHQKYEQDLANFLLSVERVETAIDVISFILKTSLL